MVVVVIKANPPQREPASPASAEPLALFLLKRDEVDEDETVPSISLLLVVLARLVSSGVFFSRRFSVQIISGTKEIAQTRLGLDQTSLDVR
jgi:hypothetical protein